MVVYKHIIQILHNLDILFINSYSNTSLCYVTFDWLVTHFAVLPKLEFTIDVRVCFTSIYISWRNTMKIR